MKLILVILGSRKQVNFFKLHEAVEQFQKKDKILVSGTIKKCAEARRILSNLGIEPLEIVLDLKGQGTKNFVKGYMNSFRRMTLISEHSMEERLIKSMYRRELEIIRI